MRRKICLALSVLPLALPAVADAKDYAGTALNIIPSGQYGGLPVPANAGQQAEMYDSLTPLFDQVTNEDLTRAYKPEALGTAGSCPCRTERTPRKGVKLVRDRFNVPHITGKTRDDATWAAGWVLQEDRGLLLAQGRYPGRMAALDAPGVDAFKLVTGLKTVTVTKQADRIIDKAQTGALLAQGAEGRALLHDIDVYITGINARMRAEKSKGKPFTRVDVYSVNALAGQIFGQGGGDEVRRSQLLSGLKSRLGAAQGQQVFDDLSAHQDEDTPTTMTTRFGYEGIPSGAGKGNAIVDPSPATTRTLRNGVEQVADRTKRHTSNFLIVGKQRSATGHPLFVAGPQIGYFYPGLTLEMDLKAPGLEARGAAMPGGPGNILIGRGADFAWSLTSAGSDTNDLFVETLCGGSKTKYLFNGKCRTMGAINAGTIKGVGAVKYRTTTHGPVLGYGTVGGKQVAITFARSSRGKDVLWQLMFSRLSQGKVTGAQSFFKAAATSPFTFNVGYADDRDIATYSAGLLPIRAKDVDPRLPTIGDGKHEWRGFLPAKDHAHQVNPPTGKLVNWNNKPAPGFGSSDAEWTYGSTQRVQLLDAGIAKRQTHDLASVVGAMNAAATQDLRVAGSVFDGIVGVLNTTPPPSAREAKMLEALVAWRNSGSSRLDRDLDGKADAGAGPAIMDAAWPRIADAVLAPVLGPQNAELANLEGVTNGPGTGFTGGRISYVDKDLRQLLGTPFKSPLKTRFCGAGDLAACSASLWGALKAAGDEIAAAQGTDDPAAWTSDVAKERISFAPGLLKTTIRYTNRPSGIQQVISFSGHRPGAH